MDVNKCDGDWGESFQNYTKLSQGTLHISYNCIGQSYLNKPQF